MPEHIEVETQELQDKINEAHEESRTHEHRDWVRYVGLSTAILAVIAAIAALQSGSLVNEALMHQIRASDTWAQYQASREKTHIYTVAFNALVDQNAANVAVAAALHGAKAPQDKTVVAGAKTPAQRAVEYRQKLDEETSKQQQSSASAHQLEKTAEEELERQHRFEYAVALIQIAIALGAVAALARLKSGWYASMVAGAIGIAFVAGGFLGF
jgi:hypothetical protein